jgi:hypothetical protein
LAISHSLSSIIVIGSLATLLFLDLETPIATSNKKTYATRQRTDNVLQEAPLAIEIFLPKHQDLYSPRHFNFIV